MPDSILLCGGVAVNFLYVLTSWLEQSYKHNMDFIESINALQDMWRAEPYPQHETFTLRELRNRAGGAASHIPKLVFACHYSSY